MHNGAKNVELEITLTLQNFQNKIKKFKKKSSLKNMEPYSFDHEIILVKYQHFLIKK